MKNDEFPKKIPVFPLSNFIIFPKTTVPLNIFEPRYVEMINDSMKTDKRNQEVTKKMGYISNVEDARKKLEDLFKDT